MRESDSPDQGSPHPLPSLPLRGDQDKGFWYLQLEQTRAICQSRKQVQKSKSTRKSMLPAGHFTHPEFPTVSREKLLDQVLVEMHSWI